MAIKLDSKVPGGELEEKWSKYKFDMKLVNPANKRKHTVIVQQRLLNVLIQRNFSS